MSKITQVLQQKIEKAKREADVLDFLVERWNMTREDELDRNWNDDLIHG